MLLLVNPFAGAFKLLYDNCEGFRNVVDNMVQRVKDAFSNMLEKVKEIAHNIGDAVKNGIQLAVDFITSLPSKALQWGRDFIQGFVDGIRSMISSVIDAVKGIANTVAEWLHFSRPEKGPLREYESWICDLEHLHELREDQHLVAALHDLHDHVLEGVELAGRQVVGESGQVDLEQARMAADLAQLEQGVQDGHLALGQALFVHVGQHLGAQLAGQGGVELGLGLFQSAAGDAFHVTFSIFGGRSLATSALVRRKMKGRTRVRR